MDKIKTLRRYGLFDAKVPRYTSYPPANRFEIDIGRANQEKWLRELDPSAPVSLYVHIPFCRRLCWFCACRTQGTQTLKPVEDYISVVINEISAIAALVPKGLKMARLHLGGGTPTLLTDRQMGRLLEHIHAAFTPSDTFEFSVEVDPTDASDAVLAELARWGLARASIGVQDFDPQVQCAIGRKQSLGITEQVISQLRKGGIKSLNIDLLYGLPFQTEESLCATLDKVAAQAPDRLALYGYAHVPHMSKRQIMIDAQSLPNARARYDLAVLATRRLSDLGYLSLGIDHFALPHDSLAAAGANGRMKRNFQGYTDEPCETLIGLGASAISRFPQGYAQNAVATAAYSERIGSQGMAAHKGYVMTVDDQLVSDMIESLMCDGCIPIDRLRVKYRNAQKTISACLALLRSRFADVFVQTESKLILNADYFELVRIIAAELDQGLSKSHKHSLAV